MSGKRDDRGGGDFVDSVGDVKPLAGREKLRPRPEPSERPPRLPLARLRRFVVERRGDDVFARAEDVSRKQLADLRAGRVPVEREVDLHGLDAASARRRLLDALGDARAAGIRCVLVIHGVGHHSASGPVLKAALPEWLQDESIGDEVLAFATAPQREGGPGASLVLLRRRRPA